MTARPPRRCRLAGVAGLVLVLSSIPAATTTAQTADEFVGYTASASGTAFSAFPTVPALLPVDVPIEATLSLATATLTSGGQGFGRASSLFPGSLLAALRPLIETAAGVRLPLPDYPLVVESRDFEGAKRSEVPGLTMTSDVDPDRAVAVADVGALGLPAILGVRSLRAESSAVLEDGRIVATSTTTVNGIEVGLLTIGSVVSTSSVASDGTSSTCTAEVSVNDVRVAGTRATIDDAGIHVDGATAVPGLDLGRTIVQLLEATGLQARVLDGDSECDGPTGNSTAAGLLISLPLPAIAAVPEGGGLTVSLGSTSATAGASILPPAPEGATPPPVLGDVVTRLPGPGIGGVDLPPVDPPRSGPGVEPLPAEVVAYAFDGVPVALLVGLLLASLPLATRIRRYVQRISALVSTP